MTDSVSGTGPGLQARDPLLSAARGVVGLIQVFITLGFVLMLFVLGAVVTVQRGHILARFAEAGGSPYAYPALLLGVALVLVTLHLSRRFFSQLGEVIGSVSAGDPFSADNADRLDRMGWLTVAAAVASFLVSLIYELFEPYAKAIGATHDGGPGILVSLLLALVLFILARVFRAGAAMRADLEGTV